MGGRAKEEANGKVVPREESHYIWWFQASLVDRTQLLGIQSAKRAGGHLSKLLLPTWGTLIKECTQSYPQRIRVVASCFARHFEAL